MDTADFCIGEDAVSLGAGAQWPIRHGIVEDWSHMERFWQQSIHRHGGCPVPSLLQLFSHDMALPYRTTYEESSPQHDHKTENPCMQTLAGACMHVSACTVRAQHPCMTGSCG